MTALVGGAKPVPCVASRESTGSRGVLLRKSFVRVCAFIVASLWILLWKLDGKTKTWDDDDVWPPSCFAPSSV